MPSFSKREDWYLIIVILAIYIPVQLFYLLTLLPYFPLKLIGKGNGYKRKHYIVNEHMSQFVLQPKNYMKHVRNIHKQIVKDSHEINSRRNKDNAKDDF